MRIPLLLAGLLLLASDSLAAEHTFTVSSASVNQARFGYTRRKSDRSSGRLVQPLTQATRIPNIPASSFADVLPTYDIIGFLESPEGVEVYFHRNSVLHDRFDQLTLGQEVRFVA